MILLFLQVLMLVAFPTLCIAWAIQRLCNRPKRNRYISRVRLAYRKWVRARNERKLRKAMGWRSGWAR